MPKTICSCGDDSQIKYFNESETYRTHFHLDNTFIPVFENPSRKLKELVSQTNNIKLVDRVNCLSCDDNVSTEEKLKVRKKDRPTPYRVPYNHFRKVSSCDENCITNVKIIKDISCSNINCPTTTYAISRLVDKNGVRNLNNGGNYKNYLQASGKNYELNTFGILPENSVQGEKHLYRIGALEDTVYNSNSGTTKDTNCRLQYSATTSLTEKSFTLSKINTTTKKYSNPKHRISGSVSCKAHIHRKKFRNKLAGQITGKDGYNNCRNGALCTLYMAPGPNTKQIMGKTSTQRCIPPRINGMKQKCPPINTQSSIVSLPGPSPPVTPISIVTPIPTPIPPGFFGVLINISLLPLNFLGGNRPGAAGLGEGYFNDPPQFKNPCAPWESTVPSKFGYTTPLDYKFSVVLKFKTLDGMPSGSRIKLTMKRPPDGFSGSLGEDDDGPIFNQNQPWPLNNPPSGNYSHIELKSGLTPKNISSVSFGTFVTPFPGSQEIILTIGEDIFPSEITINFFNEGFNNWQNNAKDGTALTFDLEVDGHTSSTDNLGWFSQDITTGNVEGFADTTLTLYGLFKSGDPESNPDITTITYRHYSAIPKDSRIRLIFMTNFVKQSNIDYTIFNHDGTNFTGATDIVNTSSPDSNECGIWINSKDLNDATTNNNIAIGSFTIGGLKKANYVPPQNFFPFSYPNTNYGSIEYLEFTINESGGIPGDNPSNLPFETSKGGKYIEININMRKAITRGVYLPGIVGGLLFSIQVFNSFDVLIGGAYNLDPFPQTGV